MLDVATPNIVRMLCLRYCPRSDRLVVTRKEKRMEIYILAKSLLMVLAWVAPVVLVSLGVVWYLERGEDD